METSHSPPTPTRARRSYSGSISRWWSQMMGGLRPLFLQCRGKCKRRRLRFATEELRKASRNRGKCLWTVSCNCGRRIPWPFPNRIIVRQLEGLVRLNEALARMNLDYEVRPEYGQETLVRGSTQSLKWKLRQSGYPTGTARARTGGTAIDQGN
jgi:hypothetical protein